MKLMAIGPMPPEDGGTTILFNQFISYIDSVKDVDYLLIDTNNRNSIYKFSFFRLCRVLFLMLLNIYKFDIVSLHVSKPSLSLLFPFVLFISKLFRKKIIVRKFGGDFYKSMCENSLSSRFIIIALSFCDRVCFETKSEVTLFNKITKNELARWMPNSRFESIKVSGFKFKNDIPNAFNIVFFGNVTFEKGVLDLIEASVGVNNLQVHIFGPCSDCKILNEINKVENCYYYGVVPSENVASIISKSSLLCLPTYYSGEGYPGVIIEAFSVGVPVISTYWKCIPEIVIDEKNGLLVNIKDPSSLRSAIIHLMSNSTFLASLARNAKSSFHQFESNTVHASFLEEHRSLL